MSQRGIRTDIDGHGHRAVFFRLGTRETLKRIPLLHVNMSVANMKEKSFELYTDAKRQGVWDPNDIDLEGDLADWETMSEAEASYIQAIVNDFWAGEEHVARTLSPYPQAVGKIENPPFDPIQEEMFLNAQIFEETKHADFFARYFEEVLQTDREEHGQAYDDEGYHTKDLYEVQDELIKHMLADNQNALVSYAARAFMIYMGLMENQHARVGYVRMELVYDELRERYGREDFLSGLWEGYRKVRTDEGRHIMNGQWMLKNFAGMDERVVQEQYEPIFLNYLEHRFPTAVDSGSFAFDVTPLIKAAKQSMETTVDIVGPDRFDEFADVEDAILTHTSLTASDVPW
jgi:ribonucleoside-diphosphate reductase beta chain